MDKISKALTRIPAKQRAIILQATEQIISGDLQNLDIKKLKGSEEIFRVRVGQYRVIFAGNREAGYIVLSIAKRNEQTYKQF